MNTFSWTVELRNGGRGEDRAACIEHDGRLVAVVADGAGGVGGGAEAAELVVRAAADFARGLHATPEAALRSVDVELVRLGRMSTGVIIELKNGIIRGASCGDSVAWLLSEEKVLDLTHAQQRKPLLGDGAVAISFEGQLCGRLMLASDGLTNFTSRNKIWPAAISGSLKVAGNNVADLPRLRSGKYPDDVAVVLIGANV